MKTKSLNPAVAGIVLAAAAAVLLTGCSTQSKQPVALINSASTQEAGWWTQTIWQPDEVTLPGVLFTADSTALSDQAKPTLQPVAAQLLIDLKRSGPVYIAIAGHTAATNTPDANKPFSQKRAEAVRDQLVADGVPAGVLTLVFGCGQAYPAASDATPSGQAQNRRVTISISPTPLSEADACAK